MRSDFSAGYQESLIRLSDSESKRFGQRIGRGSFSCISERDADELVKDLVSFDLVFLRIPAHSVRLVQKISTRGFDLFQADNLLYFVNENLEGLSHSGWCIDKGPPLAKIQEHVAESFAGYLNHYTADLFLKEGKSLEGYLEWSSNLYYADDIESIYLLHGDKVGALALASSQGDALEVILNSVIPELQGLGLYNQMLQMVEYRALEMGRSLVRISTQSTNIRVINALIKSGYKLESSFLTLHVRPLVNKNREVMVEEVQPS